MSVGLGVLVLSYLVLHSDLLSVSDQLASVLSCLVAIAGAVITVSVQRRPAVEPAERLRQAGEELALRIRRQWTREATGRGLLHSEPLHVRWASTARPVQADPTAIVGPGVTRLKLHGDVMGIAAAFRQLPQRKLVVIGAPGAGKSSLAVLLVNGLLDEPPPGDPVPVLLNIAGWDPAEHLDAWLARQLAEQHPFLGREMARELVERDRVLPILDGLDEMPVALHPAAIAALDDALGGKRPFVLTCRAQEYEELMAATGRPLPGAAVIEIAPVGAVELVDYLPSGQIDGPARWRAVLDEIESHPDGPLAQALDSPLMVYLTRTAYSEPGTAPAELLTFGDRLAVERHLLGAYLPTVYRPRPPAASPASRLLDIPAADAERWLTVLARDADRRGAPGIGRGARAWFGIARVEPALRRRLPLRLRTFLEDAHRRGVLRQVGAVYQFRHARLQAYLAEE
ncbi:NACHT domain-containing protein [Paractinoplanes durhamensis]|uniref:NACHT domain-containing protein n=1 Tax=Paractinoplanes durhamensis TaxID=113563 RepID=UPI0019422B25|nr:NACHT domain-containing protein [Actinoplanes durhamensis]